MTEIYIGILSGTSMDAIDVAAVSFEEDQAKTLHAMNVELPSEYKQQYLDIIEQGGCSFNELGELDEWTGELFSSAITSFLSHFKIEHQNIKAVGSHGQTIWHAPDLNKPFTMQLGNPHTIARRTNLIVAADFRRSDIACGGQGAPLAPLFHEAVFSHPRQARCIVNIGGLSNITILDKDKVLGFDTGPGNCLMDTVVKEKFNLPFDKDGAIAKTGKIDEAQIRKWLQDPYFSLPPPKSTGREYFNTEWMGDLNLEARDLLNTLANLTAVTICDSIKQYAPASVEVYLCGGGAHNSYILSMISESLEREVKTTASLGIDPDWVEACLFAWMAKMRIDNHYIDARSVTGAQSEYVPGALFTP